MGRDSASAYEKEGRILNGHFGSHFKRIKQAIEENELGFIDDSGEKKFNIPFRI